MTRNPVPRQAHNCRNSVRLLIDLHPLFCIQGFRAGRKVIGLTFPWFPSNYFFVYGLVFFNAVLLGCQIFQITILSFFRYFNFSKLSRGISPVLGQFLILYFVDYFYLLALSWGFPIEEYSKSYHHFYLLNFGTQELLSWTFIV